MVVHCTVQSSLFHVPGRISTSQGKQYSTDTDYYEAKRDCTPNEWFSSSKIYVTVHELMMNE